MKKYRIIVLLLLIHAAGVSAETPDSPICIPFETDGEQIAILIQGKISSDKVDALQAFIREQLLRPDFKEESIRIAILRDGVCIPSE